MAGYHNYSMSNNAVIAYQNGEKPLSKWTKAEILDRLPDSLKASAKRLTVSEAKGLFLRHSSWHHTSSMFNRTDFYTLRDAEEVTAADIEEVIARRKPKPEKPQAVKALVRYGEWVGTRKRPKLIEKESYAILVGNWAYLPEGKKRTDGKHFTIITTYPRAPKGAADIFKQIERNRS